MSFVLAVLLVATTSADQQASSPVPAETTAPAKKPRKICREDSQDTGTRMARRVCLTQEEWDRRAGGMTNSARSGFSGKAEDR